jgi:hypothetical protein
MEFTPPREKKKIQMTEALTEQPTLAELKLATRVLIEEKLNSRTLCAQNAASKQRSFWTNRSVKATLHKDIP